VVSFGRSTSDSAGNRLIPNSLKQQIRNTQA
jgi:hypothetical protein